jgi:thioredoxin-like negative regulator of GroEL
MAQDITTAEELAELAKQGKSIVIKFWAEWCKPCIAFTPHFVKAAENYTGANFVAVDCDEADEIVEMFGIRNIPTIVLIESINDIVDVSKYVAYPAHQFNVLLSRLSMHT